MNWSLTQRMKKRTTRSWMMRMNLMMTRWKRINWNCCWIRWHCCWMTPSLRMSWNCLMMKMSCSIPRTKNWTRSLRSLLSYYSMTRRMTRTNYCWMSLTMAMPYCWNWMNSRLMKMSYSIGYWKTNNWTIAMSLMNSEMSCWNWSKTN